MSLHWDLTKIENYKTKCWIRGKLNVTTNALIWGLFAIDMTNITRENWREVYRRLWALEKWRGAFRNKTSKRAKCGHVPVYFTEEEVRSHIGLTTNVRDRIRACFMRKMRQLIEDDMSYQAKDEPKEN